MLKDAARGEAIEKELDLLIERRALKADSEWAHREKARRENRALWYAHEMRMCELHEGLAAEHGAKAVALLEEEG